MRRTVHAALAGRSFVAAIQAAALYTLIAGCATQSKGDKQTNDHRSLSPEAQQTILRLEGDVAAAPTDADLAYALGNAYFDADRVADALSAYRKAIELHPQHAKAHCNTGLCLRRMGRLPEAIEAYRASLAIEPDNLTTLHNLIIALKQTGDLTAAIEPLKRVAECKAGDAFAKSDLANALFALQRYPEAADAYKEVIQLDPGVSTDYYNLGLCYYNQNDLDSALLTWLSALAHGPNNAAVRRNMPVLYWERKEYDKAWEAVKECRRLGILLNPGFLSELRKDSGRAGPD